MSRYIFPPELMAKFYDGNATAEETTDAITKKSYANAYNEEGDYSTDTIS